LPFITGKFIEKDGFVLSNYGVWMQRNFPDKTFYLSILGYRNRLERHLKSIRKPFIFFDVGSNQGVFSLLSSKNKYCRKVHIFEPNSDLIRYLTANLEFNGVTSYKIHNYAISDKIGNVPFFVPASHSGAARIVEKEGFDNFCESINRHYLNEAEKYLLDPIFLKLDVEGSEFLVLTEFFNSLLFERIEYIFIEMNSNIENTAKLLSEMGFIEESRKGTRDSFDALYLKNNRKLS
jgi:FkbM family methyltransferase